MTNSIPPQVGPVGSRDDEDSLLASLPSYDVAPGRAERIRRQSHVLLRESRTARQPSSGWSLSYHRFVEPGVLIALGLWQLAWTVRDTVALFH